VKKDDNAPGKGKRVVRGGAGDYILWRGGLFWEKNKRENQKRRATDLITEEE